MTEASTAAQETAQQDPAAEQTASEPSKPVKKSLEDSLADLDEPTRTFVLGEVTSARSEAKNLRDRLKAAEPKISEYDRLVEAGKDKETRLQEAAQAAEDRARAAQERVIAAELRAALTGVVDDPAAVIEDLNLSKFKDSDGEVDTAAIDALKAKYARLNAAAAAPRQPRPDASQASGANGNTGTDPRAAFGAFLQDQIRRPG